MARTRTGGYNTSANNVQPQVTDWGNQNNGWTGCNIGTTTWPGNGIGANNVNVGTTDLFGTTTYSQQREQVNYGVSHIISMMKDAVNIYDRGVKPRVDVAKEVDKLRRRISSGTFDPQNSPELKNIFGFMFGDVIADIANSNGGDYDSIIDYIMESFPEGSGGPVESKYIKSQINSQINNAVKAIRTYERRNGLVTTTSKGKFVKLIEQFKLVKPDIIIPDLDLLWDAYQN